MAALDINVDKLGLYFKNLLQSVRLLNEYLLDREGVRQNIWGIRRNIDVAVRQIDAIALDSIEKSKHEVEDAFAQLHQTFQQEIAAWIELKDTVARGAADQTIEDALSLLEGIHNAERMLIPVKVDYETVNAFLDRMRTMKKARVRKVARVFHSAQS